MKYLAALTSAAGAPPPIQRPTRRKTPSSRNPPAMTLMVCIELPCLETLPLLALLLLLLRGSFLLPPGLERGLDGDLHGLHIEWLQKHRIDVEVVSRVPHRRGQDDDRDVRPALVRPERAEHL